MEKLKVYQVEEEFIKRAHKAACPEWKQILEKRFPEAFKPETIVGLKYRVIDCSYAKCLGGKNVGNKYDSSTEMYLNKTVIISEPYKDTINVNTYDFVNVLYNQSIYKVLFWEMEIYQDE